jgi:hypothetical protein
MNLLFKLFPKRHLAEAQRRGGARSAKDLTQRRGDAEAQSLCPTDPLYT